MYPAAFKDSAGGSVGGVDFSRPERWTRLHCSELHWRVPVALLWDSQGAREQQRLRTWIIFLFCRSEARLTRPT